jgi:RNA polymerase sigma factor (sigma-70 family)
MGVTGSIGRHNPEVPPPASGVTSGASDAAVSGAVLMRRYASGDASAFNQLYSRYAPPVYHLFLGLTRNRQEREDLAQATFLKVHRARTSFAPGADLLPWLMTIARRCFRDDRRTRAARNEILWPGENLESHGGGGVPDSHDCWRLDRALAGLPPLTQAALLFTEFLGYSLEEAAATLDSTPGSIEVHAHRGRRQLRKLLDQAG